MPQAEHFIPWYSACACCVFDSVGTEHVRQVPHPRAASSVPCTQLLSYYMKPCLCAKIHIKPKRILFRLGSQLKESHPIYVWITLSPRTKHHAWSIWTRGGSVSTRRGGHPLMRKKLDRNNSLHSVCKYRISKWCLSHIKQLLVKVTGPKCFTQELSTPGLGAMKPWQQQRTLSPKVTEKCYLPLRRARRNRGSGLWLS